MLKIKEIEQLFEKLTSQGKTLVVGQVVGEQSINIYVTSEDVASFSSIKVRAQRGDTAAPPTSLPREFDTVEARRLLECARRRGWLDEQYQPRISQRKLSVLALIISSRLQLHPRWEPFERLWGVRQLASLWSKAQLLAGYDCLVKEFESGLDN